MCARFPRRNASGPLRSPRRSLAQHPSPALAAIVLVLSVAGGCGRDEPRPTAGAGDPASAASRDAPLATYRLAASRSVDGETITIEAIAPCRVVLEIEQDGLRQGERSRNLDPGDATRVSWSVLRSEEPSTPGATSTRRENVHRVRYGFDDADVRESSVRIPTATPTPWIRIATAVPPLSSKPFPTGPMALAALGIVDLPSHAGIELLLEPAPVLKGVPEGTPPAALHLAMLWLAVRPR